MRRIRMLEAVAGSDFSWAPGDIVTLDDEAAAGWADGHRATWADDDGVELPPAELTPLVQTRDGIVLPVASAEVVRVEPDDPQAGDNVAGLDLVRWTVTVDLPDDLAAALGLHPDGGLSIGLVPEANPAAADPDVAGGDQAAFDPAEHTVADVLAYLAGTGEQEAVRVLDAEVSGQDRRGIAKARDEVLAAARANDTERAGGDHAGAEKAVTDSRGGGRTDVPETR